jgi:hypothetical protein
MQAAYGEKELNALLDKVKAINTDIGDFQSFTFSEKLDYVIKLSNGKIRFSETEIMDDITEGLNEQKLTTIAFRFNKDQAPTKPTRPDIFKFFVLAILFIVLAFCIVQIVIKLTDGSSKTVEVETYDDEVTVDDSETTEDDAETTVEDSESTDATIYLVISEPYFVDIQDADYKINCEIYNSSSTVTFKDAKIKITYYSDAEVEIGTEYTTIYETFEQDKDKTFELTVDKFDYAYSVELQVVRADSY